MDELIKEEFDGQRDEGTSDKKCYNQVVFYTYDEFDIVIKCYTLTSKPTVDKYIRKNVILNEQIKTIKACHMDKKKEIGYIFAE